MNQELASHSFIGGALRDARTLQKLSVEDVCSRLHLSDKQIIALEQDDFSVFGSTMLARGFIKNYARLLSLDPEPLLDAHRQSFPQDQAQSIEYKSADLVSQKNLGLGKIITLVFVALILMATLFWVGYKVWIYQSSKDQAKATTPISGIHQETVSEAMPEAALPLAERVSPSGADSSVTEIELPKTKEQTAPKAIIANIKKTSDKPADLVSTADALKSEPINSSITPKGSVTVKLVLTGSSWIGVQDKTGRTVFSKLAKAGTEEFVNGLPPLKFHIGNASATQVIFNGETIDLTPNTFNNMARITLGEQ